MNFRGNFFGCGTSPKCNFFSENEIFFRLIVIFLLKAFDGGRIQGRRTSRGGCRVQILGAGAGRTAKLRYFRSSRQG
jgi:hypothetical protein